MPYITQTDRNILEQKPPTTAGELNYMMTILAIQFVRTKGLSYETLNAVVGAFDSAKVEFQRRLVAPYEDTKIATNGDVYPTLEELRR